MEMVRPGPRIGIVGIGPTAVYTLKSLLTEVHGCDITLFEASEDPGPGRAFNARDNGSETLANIASFELPPVCDTLTAWACRQPRPWLEEWGIEDHAGDERAFFPRPVLGAYFADQLDELLKKGLKGGELALRANTRVTDVVAGSTDAIVRWIGVDGKTGSDRFDHLIVATGYHARGVKQLGPKATKQVNGFVRNIGVFGSSLSAIDAVLALAAQRGEFSESAEGVVYHGESAWHATMLSRNGLLPEADFWFPYPPVPLEIFTSEAVAAIAKGEIGDLDRIFVLFKRQLALLDPDYADSIALYEITADEFAARYFAARLACDPFEHAARNLADARRSYIDLRSPPWRRALLLMHEIFSEIAPGFAASDRARFNRGLKRCFVDNYATVPHRSTERLLALNAAGRLSLERLGGKYQRNNLGGGGCEVVARGRRWRFDSVIDARGQQPLGLVDFPFPTLRLQLCAQACVEGRRWDEGVVAEDGFVVDRDDIALRRIHILSLPFLLQRRPFIQGLCESAAMGEVVARSVAADEAGHNGASSRATWRWCFDSLTSTELVFCGPDVVVELPAANSTE